uniref:Fibronectin type-III domain-containing protein n=1 Tax=Tetraodon nigroviridis TaxID=99883 RepID=H3C4L3_TETNG
MLTLSSLLTSDPGSWWEQGRVKLTVLSEDRLQMKWKEPDGPVQGYKVHPELMLSTRRGRVTVAGLDPHQEYVLRILLLNGTSEKLLAKRHFSMEGLWEEEMTRRGSHPARRNTILPGGSGSGDLDSVADVLLSSSTVSEPERAPPPPPPAALVLQLQVTFLFKLTADTSSVLGQEVGN